MFGIRLHMDYSINIHDDSLVGKLWSIARERTQNGEKELSTTLISRALKKYSEKEL